VVGLEILQAEYLGFCGGVDKAVKRALAAARDGPIFALGPLAHNESLQQKLEENGITTVESLADIPKGATLLIRTHGAEPEVFAEAEKHSLKVIDATCPYVKKLQKLVADLVGQGKNVVIAGDPLHPEVKAVVAWGEGKPFVVSSPHQLEELNFDTDTALVSQTTQRQGITDEISEKLKELVPALEIYNTICLETARRQEAAWLLADQVDVMVVIGGRQSSNTRKLAEICRVRGVKTIVISEAGELDAAQLRQAGKVGITAGASTPDWTIKEVIGKMEEQEKNKGLQEEQAAAEGQAEPEEAVEEQKPDESQTEQEHAAVEAKEEAQEDQAALEQEFSAQDLKEFSVGDVVKGVVEKVDDDEVLVNIGDKSEGVLPRQEMIVADGQNLSDVVQMGEELELVVKKVNTDDGRILLSRKVLERKSKWQELEAAFQDGTVLSGKVKEAVPAGLVVDLGGGFEGFMPGSLVDLRYIPDFSEFLNQQIEFKVIELRREKEKVVLSRKQVLEDEAAGKKEETLASLSNGQIIRGTVKRLTNFGAFVDVGGIDGLIHISEISWHRIEHPSEALSVGQEVEVKVIEVIPERERIGLSLRQALPDPWTEISRKLKAGDVVEGKVTRLVSFGAFVELIPGVEGLVHISQMASYHVKQASEVVQEGQLIKVKILDINTEAKRVSLSIREANPRPKKEAAPKQELPADTGGLTLGDVFGNLFDRKEEE
jgi:small subunit ribosomal protein S1